MSRTPRQHLLLVAAAVVFAITYFLETSILGPRRLAMQGYMAALPRALVHAASYNSARAAGERPRFIPGEQRLDISDLPSRAAALSLGGLRGFFAIYLWMQAENQKNLRIHDDLLDTYYRIASLQPDYPATWSFHAWNLAYNLSVQWSTPERRYEWVRHGINFLAEGIRRNPDSVELLEKMGQIYYWKIGNNNNADDRAYFSAQVVKDDGASPLLLAYEWYDRARRIQDEAGVPHPMFSRKILHGQACHAMHAYAKEVTRQALNRLRLAAEMQKAGPPDETAEAEAAHRKAIAEEFKAGRAALDKALGLWKTAGDEWESQKGRFPNDYNANIFGQGAYKAGQLLERFAEHMTVESLQKDPRSFLIRVKSAQGLDLLVKPFTYQEATSPSITL
ncbi:MAG: hypothetical protein GWP05_04415 [Anaerolineaceae bacterium]|nr:hypothetical protein [Anaerolineaceae bacterium]